MIHNTALTQYCQDQYAGTYLKVISDSFHFTRINNLKKVHRLNGDVPYFDQEKNSDKMVFKLQGLRVFLNIVLWGNGTANDQKDNLQKQIIP